MASRAREEYRYEKLTWPEINDAIELGKVCLVPCGAVEQHGHAPAARRGSRLPARDRPRRRAGDRRPAPRPADHRLRLHRPRDGLPRDDQHRLRALHAPGARRHQEPGLPRVQEDHPVQRPRIELAEPRPGRPADQPGDGRRMRADLLVEPPDGGQGVPAPLAAEQVPGRLLARLRAGDVALSLPRRRQRAQGPDQERDHQLQRRGQPVPVGRPVRGRAGDDHLLDQQLLRDGRARRRRAGDPREGAARRTRRRSASSCGSSPGSTAGRRTCAATCTDGRRPCRSPGGSGRSATDPA